MRKAILPLSSGASVHSSAIKLPVKGPAPGYAHRTYYVRKDITRYLKNGTNTLAFHVYYQGLVNRVWVSGDLLCGLIFDVVSQGKVLARSDESVKAARHTGYTALSAAGYDTQFMERFDSRVPEVGFEQPRSPTSRSPATRRSTKNSSRTRSIPRLSTRA